MMQRLGASLAIVAASGVAASDAATAQVMNHFPQWSPDGAWILYTSNRTGGEELFLVSPDGSEVRQLTDDDVPDSNVGWTPDGRVVFQSMEGGEWRRYSIEVDGSGRRRTADPDTVLARSAPARRIAFSSTRDGRSQLFTATPDGRDVRPLTTAGHAEQPSFSPDGRRMVFEERDDAMAGVNTSRIVVSSPDGSEAHVVADGGTDPQWSPDGSRILYKHWIEGSRDWVIATVGWNGESAEMLRPGVHPGWSPDGERIVFMTEDGMDTHIRVMRADGEGQMCLTCGVQSMEPR